MTSSRRSGSKILRIALGCAGGLFFLILIPLIAVQIVLSPKVCTNLVKEYAPMFIDGKLELSSVSINLFSHFPAVSAEIDSLKITYPSFQDSTVIDTLASFDHFDVSVNVLSLLHRDLNIKRVELSHPRAFVHFYEDGSSNLKIFKIVVQKETAEVDDSSKFALNDIIVRKVIVDNDGYLELRSDADEITLSADLKRIYAVSDGHGGVDIDAKIGMYADTHAFGRIEIPVCLDGFVGVSHDRDNDLWGIVLDDVDLDVATVHIDADANVMLGENIKMKGKVDIPNLNVQRLLSDYVADFVPEVKKINTDAFLSASFSADGVLDQKTKESPAINASIRLECPGLHLSANGSSEDIVSEDPYIRVKTRLTSSLDTLSRTLSKALNVNMSGSCDMTVDGGFKLSNLSLAKCASADLDIKAGLYNVRLSAMNDSLDVYVSDLNLKGGLYKSRFRKSNKKVFGIGLELDSLYLNHTDNESVSGSGVKVFIQSSPDSLTAADGTVYNPLFASVSLGRVFLHGVDSMSVSLHNSVNRFAVYPMEGEQKVPAISVSSENGRAGLRYGPNRVFLRGLNFKARAQMNNYIRKRRVEHFLDSVYDAHPTWNKDSLHQYMAKKHAEKQTPIWLSEEDFKKSDIRLDLGESLTNYYKKWDISGTLALDRLGVRTPAFPLKMNVHQFNGSFENDFLSLDTLQVQVGSSRIEAKGKVSNLRRFILRDNGVLKLTAQASTDTLSVTEIVTASAKGQEFLSMDMSSFNNVDDETYDAMLDKQYTEIADTVMSPIIIPGNVDADFSVTGKNISIYGVELYQGSGTLKMKDRCLQMTNSAATSSVGNISLDAFYSSQTKTTMAAGFDVSLQDISAGQVISLMPQIDTLMPLLKSFDGLIDCSLAATTRLDSVMNVILPSVDAVIRISGKDLHFNDSKEVERLGRLLLFKNPKRATIDSLTVEALLHDGQLEVFPFILQLDRWKLAMSGIHNVDQSFKYNVSLVKTPLIFKIGADIYGNNNDDVKVKLGKAKFKKPDLPSFSAIIDTTRINLVESIREVYKRGVEFVMKENENNMDISKEREEIGYKRSAALDTLETLSPLVQRQLDSMRVEQAKADTLVTKH